jgi:hypothetical protein
MTDRISTERVEEGIDALLDFVDRTRTSVDDRFPLVADA